MPFCDQICCCRQRYLIVFLLAMSLYQGYYTGKLLTNIVGLMSSQNSSEIWDRNPDNSRCNITNEHPPPPYIDRRGTNYGWNENTTKRLTHSFYIGHALSLIPAGYISDRWGAKHLHTILLLTVTAIQFITPVVIDETKGNLKVLDSLRVVHGVIEGMRAPVIYTLLAHWVPRRERARMEAMICCGLFGGKLVVQLFTIPIVLKYRDWAIPFYVAGAEGLILAILWTMIGSSYPTTSSYIQPAEKFYLHVEMKNKVIHEKKGIPIKRILLSVRVMAMCFGMTGFLWTWHFAHMFAKSYMQDVLNSEMTYNQVYMWMPDVVMAAMTIFSCFVSDWAVNKDKVEKTFMRKIFTIIALMGCPIYMVMASYAVCHVDLVQVLFIMSVGFQGCAFAGIRIVPMDLSANYAGFLSGLSSTPTAILMVFAPQITEYLIPYHTVMEYRRLFYMTLGLCSLCCLVFVTIGTATTQEWNMPTQRNKNKKR